MRVDSISCRLCGASAVYQFSKRILGKYDVKLYRCEQCESLETQEPFWLEESYNDIGRQLDTGCVWRAQFFQMAIFFVARFFKISSTGKILDWGGGDGLLVRMLRNVGLDAYHYDKYANNLYAYSFDSDPTCRYEMVTAFEVWEHLTNPREEISNIFSYQPEVHMLSTNLYLRQGSDWHYLNPLTGRHVFFYSRKALKQIADLYGYHVVSYPSDITLFYRREISHIRRLLLRNLFATPMYSTCGWWKLIFEIYYAMLHKHSLVVKDFNHIVELFKE